ncbi:hypothetical protein FRB90_012153 [Tulasnella sp. 427]|nr:hypothetical protein FRB90_012153 [Tulasnella sp. 427]
MQNHLWSLARRTLVEIQCQDVELDDLPPGNTTQSTSDLQLKIVGIDSTFWKPYAPFMAIILSPQLRELKVSSTALDSVFNACGVVNDRALPTARLSALLRLEAFLISDELILLFLRCCPNLESLSIHLPPSVPSSLSSTWSNSEEKYLVPALSKYYGPVELAFLLCPGRPIRTIRLPAITRGQAPPSRSDLAILQSGSVPLEALEFRVQNLTETMWTDLADFLPSLKHLTITFDIMPSLVSSALMRLAKGSTQMAHTPVLPISGGTSARGACTANALLGEVGPH